MSCTRRILSIDGGGIKGALPVGFLERVEAIAGQRVVDHFDLIAGTSTGGIIAIGLGLGLSAADLLSFFQESGPAIFGATAPRAPANWRRKVWGLLLDKLGRRVRAARQFVGPKHEPRRLREALGRVLGDRVFGESLTRLVVPAYHADRQTVHVFKTSHHERFEFDHAVQAVDVALATAAAPTYLPAHELPSGAPLIDGGIWANNPVGLAVVEAIGVLGWDRANLKVLSLGCTEETFIPHPRAGIAQLGPGAIDLLLQGQSRGSLGTAKILAGAMNVHRISPNVPRGLFTLDGTAEISRLVGMGAECAREAMPMVRREFLIKVREEFVPFHGARSVGTVPRAAQQGTRRLLTDV